MMTIRPAKPEDAPAIARVHVDSWRETYAGIVPDDFLANLKVERREAMWSKALRAGGVHGSGIYVAEMSTAQVVGFASGGKCRTPELGFSGELYAIYLMRSHQGQGVGRRLFDAVAHDLVQEGHKSMMLWVLEDNSTVSFYKHLGGVATSSKVETIGGKPLNELALGWTDLPLWATP